MIGTSVSHYRILEKLGEGGMGEVYRAEDSKLHRDVALKFLPEDLTRDEERRARFQQEARAAAAIDHPHIGAIFDIDEADGRLFIVMEYVRGGTLRDVILDESIHLSKRLSLGSRIASGLAKAHERGVVHRDLKPENVVVTEDGFPKIIDFGVSKLLEPLHQRALGATSGGSEMETELKTREGLVLGTVTYMSPEQARGEAVDARSDIFSFGTLLYELVTGTSPFRRKSVIETLNAVLKDEPPAPPLEEGAGTHELQRILRKALAKDREHRYQSMKDVAIDLEAIHMELQSAEHPSTRASVPTARLATKAVATRLAIAAPVLGGAILLALGYLALRSDPEPTGVGASGRPAIAILHFEDHSGDEQVHWLSRGLPSMLLTGLAQTPGLDVVSSQRIHEILSELGQENVAAIDAAVISEVARRSGAGAVVVGSIFKSGDQIQIDVQVEDIGSGRVLSADSVRGSDVFPLVDELTGRIRASLEFRERGDSRSISDVTTASLEAYRLYSEGVEAYRNLRYPDARRLLERAVAMDPSFAMAYYELSGLSRFWGDQDSEALYRRKVLEHLDRLPDRERLLVQAGYARVVEDDSEKASSHLEELIARYPDEEQAYILYSQIHSAGTPGAARGFAMLSSAVDAIPTSGPLRNMFGYALINRDRYQEALQQFEAYERIAPDEPNPYDSQGEAYLLLGRPEKALERYARALAVDPEFLSSHGGRIWAFSSLGRYDEARSESDAIRAGIVNADFPPTVFFFMAAFRDSRLGQYRAAAENIASGRVSAEETGSALRHVGLLMLSTVLALETGQLDNALRDSRESLRVAPRIPLERSRRNASVAAHSLAGLVSVRSGDLNAAAEALEAAEAIYSPGIPGELWWARALRAEIALALEDLEAAETAYREGLPKVKMEVSIGAPDWSVIVQHFPSRDVLARIQVARGDIRDAVGTYRALNTPGPQSKWVAWLEPRYVLAEARLHDQLGDSESARRAYEGFLDLWNDADADRPELAEARQYLDR